MLLLVLLQALARGMNLASFHYIGTTLLSFLFKYVCTLRLLSNGLLLSAVVVVLFSNQLEITTTFPFPLFLIYDSFILSFIITAVEVLLTWLGSIVLWWWWWWWWRGSKTRTIVNWWGLLVLVVRAFFSPSFACCFSLKYYITKTAASLRSH